MNAFRRIVFGAGLLFIVAGLAMATVTSTTDPEGDNNGGGSAADITKISVHTYQQPAGFYYIEFCICVKDAPTGSEDPPITHVLNITAPGGSFTAKITTGSGSNGSVTVTNSSGQTLTGIVETSDWGDDNCYCFSMSDFALGEPTNGQGDEISVDAQSQSSSGETTTIHDSTSTLTGSGFSWPTIP